MRDRSEYLSMFTALFCLCWMIMVIILVMNQNNNAKKEKPVDPLPEAEETPAVKAAPSKRGLKIAPAGSSRGRFDRRAK